MALIDGVEVKLSNLEKVMYPATGTVKAQVVDYYRRVAPFLLPSLAGRPVTRKRWPGGVQEPAFFAKDLDTGTPPWMPRTQIGHGSGPKFYPLVDSTPGLVWLAQMNALELHVPQWRIDPPTAPRPGTGRPVRFPDRVVFDLDPGPGVGLAQCAQVALLIRDRLGWLGESMLPVTSGSKGLHLYVPMPGPITSEQASQWALQVAQQMAKALPDLVVWQMSKAIRAGKVLVDWSQNNGNKTTITPYSLRGREAPTVAAPRSWEEITGPALTQLSFEQVLDRLAAGIEPLGSFTTATGPERLQQVAGEPARRRSTRHATDPNGPARAIEPTIPTSPRFTSSPRRATKPAAAKPAAVSGRTPADAVTSWAPMLASPGRLDMITDPDGWRFEGKWDGIRIIAQHDHDGLVLSSRTGRDVTAGYPELAELTGLLTGRQAVLDGEVVAMNQAGRTDFGRLQRRMGLTRPADIDQIRRTIPVGYLIFDILALDGESLLAEPLDERRRALQALHPAGTFCLVPPQLTGDLAEILTRTQQDGWEGIVAKRGDSPYLPGARSRAWMKFKNIHDLEVAVIGWQPGQGRRDGTVGSLLLAVPARGGGWNYVGKAGSGLTDRGLAELTRLLAPLTQPTPAAEVPRADARTAVWVKPDLVGEVVYSEMTDNGTLRHPRWRGLRRDRTIADLTVT